MGWLILRLKFDFDVVELMDYTCSVILHNLLTIHSICLQFTHDKVNKENLKSNQGHCHSVTSGDIR